VSAPGGFSLITGGAGFVGTNLAARLLREGRQVLIFDNFSRPGARENLAWLAPLDPERLCVEPADIRDAAAVRAAVESAREVFHLAAQVAVTTSLDAPFEDFDVNARGTLNVLEALRALRDPPPLVYTSTNKVYGALGDVALRAEPRRYVPDDPRIRNAGIDERRPLDFHSPYGCSKGAAEQYVLDYARCFGLRTAVFRMSCIYGPHQHGNEDQGWVAHFLIRARERGTLSIFGDGRQVRDVLYVEDLVDALVLATRHMDALSGRAFNIGGGPQSTLSLVELLDIIREREGVPEVRHHPWRTGDQRYYVSDIGSFTRATGWAPRTQVRQGIDKLRAWLDERADRAAAPSYAVAGGR